MTVWTLMTIMLLFLLAPVIIGRMHAHLRKQSACLIRYTYRYFVVFNVILAGLSVVIRLYHQKPFLPSVQLLILAILSMVAFATWSIFQKDRMQLAPAILWTLFVSMGAFMHLIYYINNRAKTVSLLHLGYDVIVAMALLFFYSKLNKNQ
jgi:hypothetical protein